MLDTTISAAATARTTQTLRLLEAIVRPESPTSEKRAVDRLIDMLEAEVRGLGWSVDRVPQDEFGNILVARSPSGSAKPPIFVMTHVDTVWPLGTIDHLPWMSDGAVARGPGIYDMKASVAMMLTAADILQAHNLFGRPIIWMINTDEEGGSPVSRAILESLAREAEYVLCLEPPVPPHGALKTQRKGVGMFTLDVAGRASHAGADHSAGVSAIEEVARQIQWLHSLSNLQAGTTINVGVVSGGTKRNVVPAVARAEIDLRVTSTAEAERVVPQILSASAHLPGAQVTMTGGLNRPPMERSATIIAAFERAREIGLSIGLDLEEGSTGGGSDGNFTAALGIATIDGLGCIGDGAHEDTEHIVLAELPRRTALLAALLAQL